MIEIQVNLYCKICGDKSEFERIEDDEEYNISLCKKCLKEIEEKGIEEFKSEHRRQL